MCYIEIIICSILRNSTKSWNSCPPELLTQICRFFKRVFYSVAQPGIHLWLQNLQTPRSDSWCSISTKMSTQHLKVSKTTFPLSTSHILLLWKSSSQKKKKKYIFFKLLCWISWTPSLLLYPAPNIWAGRYPTRSLQKTARLWPHLPTFPATTLV